MPRYSTITESDSFFMLIIKSVINYSRSLRRFYHHSRRRRLRGSFENFVQTADLFLPITAFHYRWSLISGILLQAYMKRLSWWERQYTKPFDNKSSFSYAYIIWCKQFIIIVYNNTGNIFHLINEVQAGLYAHHRNRCSQRIGQFGTGADDANAFNAANR